MVTERLSRADDPRPAYFEAIGRKAIDIIVPVYKSAYLTTRCLNSLAEHIQEIAANDPRLMVINDSLGASPMYHLLDDAGGRFGESAWLVQASKRSDTDWPTAI